VIPDTREDLTKQALALVEIQERQKAFPLYFYQPNSKVVPFHKARARVRILSGGNRSGKSEANVAEAGSYALGYRPWVLRELGLPFPNHPWERPDSLPEEAICFNGLGIRVPVPNSIFVVTGQSMKKGIGETLYPKFKKLLGPFIIDEHMSHAGVPADLVLRNGSRIVFGSAEQGPQAFESTEYTFNAIDEPIPRRVYTGISRGAIDQYAPVIMTFTPIGPWSGWLFKDLYAPGLRNSIDDPNLAVFNLSIYDNQYLHPEAVEAFAKDPAISDIEKEARLYGRFMHLTDRVYQNFDDRIHVIPPFKSPDDWYHGMALDPHSVKPWAICYFTVSPDGTIFITKEWPTTDFTKIRRDPKSIEDYVSLIRRLDADLPIQLRLIDPNYGPRSETIRGRFIPSIAGDLARYGLDFHYHLNDDLNYGEGKVRQLLHYDESQPRSSLNRPRLYIFDCCTNVIQSISLYTTKARRGHEEEIDDTKRDETFKDFADLVRYIAVSEIGESAPIDAVDAMMRQFYAQDADLGITGYGE